MKFTSLIMMFIFTVSSAHALTQKVEVICGHGSDFTSKYPSNFAVEQATRQLNSMINKLSEKIIDVSAPGVTSMSGHDTAASSASVCVTVVHNKLTDL
jgi:hypothetical protein